MSSFRVKPTSALLKPYAPPPAPKKEDSKSKPATSTAPAPANNFKKSAPTQVVNKPRGGSAQGMAIRIVPTAQADHM